jgi:HK97 gp10 family phage protein
VANGDITGMAALIRGLQQLPEALAQEAEGVISATADLMAAEVRRDYPAKSGNLRKDVRVERKDRLRAQVKSAAKHAHLYEYGTVSRYLKSNGASRGTMPAQPVFVPAAVRNRRRMVERLTEIVKRTRPAGFDGTPEVR